MPVVLRRGPEPAGSVGGSGFVSSPEGCHTQGLACCRQAGNTPLVFPWGAATGTGSRVKVIGLPVNLSLGMEGAVQHVLRASSLSAGTVPSERVPSMVVC